jgi:hypothetical protein
LEEALTCLEKASVCKDGLSAALLHAIGVVQEDLGLTRNAIESYEHYLAIARPDDMDSIESVKKHLQILKSRQT